MLRKLTQHRAFTLIELLVVVLVIGILIAVALPSLLGNKDKAFDSRVKTHLAEIYHSGKPAWTANDNDYPAPGASENTDKATLIGFLEAAEPEFRFVNDSIGVAEGDDRQILTLRPQPDVVTYVAQSLSGKTFCLQAVERRGFHTPDGDPITPGLYWAWGRGELACGADAEENELPVPIDPLPEPTPTPSPTPTPEPGFGTPVMSPTCNEPDADTQPYFLEVRSDNPAHYWRLCELTGIVDRGFETAPPMYESVNTGFYITAPDPSPRNALKSEPNGSQTMNGSYFRENSPNGAELMGFRGQSFSAEAWVRSNNSYTTTTGRWEVPVLGVQCQWTIGWSGTGNSAMNGATLPMPVGANGWTAAFYGKRGGHNPSSGGCNTSGATHHNDAVRVQTTRPVEAGRWYHVVLTFDSANTQQLAYRTTAGATYSQHRNTSGTASIYVDGERIAHEFVNVPANDSLNNLFHIGSSSSDGSSNQTQHLYGGIDEVAYYHYPLSAAQVKSHYDVAQAGNYGETVTGSASDAATRISALAPSRWWRLDDRVQASRTTWPSTPTTRVWDTVSGAQLGAVSGAFDTTGDPYVRDASGVNPYGVLNRALEMKRSYIDISSVGVASLSSFTWGMWVALKPGESLTRQCVLNYEIPSSGADYQTALCIENGALVLRADNELPCCTYGSYRPFGGAGIDDGEWHHVAFTRDGVTNTLTGFVDGEQVGTLTGRASTYNFNTNYARFGALDGPNSSASPARSGLVALDEVVFFDEALTATEIDTLVNG